MAASVCVIIPSLNPDDKLCRVAEKLKTAGLEDIIVVNDGSDDLHAAPFDALAAAGATVLTHEVNRGKGRALKTAFAYVLENRPSCVGVITVDGDGQHGVEDILRLKEALIEDAGCVYLGARDFDLPDVPPRSRFGNKLTRSVIHLCGVHINDTQTGLRAIPCCFLPQLLQVGGERFEYETNMLLAFKEKSIPYRELPIQTIYIDDNGSSHFHPVLDSVRIYWLFLRHFICFAGTSLISFSLDLLLFYLFGRFLFAGFPESVQILYATVLARVFSSLLNYVLNKRTVFHVSGHVGATMVRYYVLSVCQMLTSAGLVALLCALLPIPQAITKCIVDSTLFFVSYFLQKRFVFH